MGLLDKVFGGSEEDKEEEWEDEEWEDEEWEDEWEEEEDEIQEWDTAYQFFKDAVQAAGFTDVDEFVSKAMMYRIMSSAKYRDRVSIGTQTMEMVTNTVNSMKQTRGGEGSDLGKMAEELQNANTVIKEAEKMSGEEDEMVWHIMGLVDEGLDIARDRIQTSKGVSTTIETSNEEL